MCGIDNPITFAKLHDVVMRHFAIRRKSAEAVGKLQTAVIETEIIERLRQICPGMGELAPAPRDARRRMVQG